jgi:hypothetical protein
MTTEPNRQPEGIPTGGQFATKVKSDDVPHLSTAAGEAVLMGLLADRDLVRERRERINEQKLALDLQASRYSARGLAATLLAKYPDAATLVIGENENENGCYEALSLKAADGTVLKDDADEDWLGEAAVNGTEIQELIWDLELDNDRWMAGIATNTTRKHDFKRAEINLHAAANTTVAWVEELEDIERRPLTEDEQAILVDTARAGIRELEDQTTERREDYSASELEDLQGQLDAAWKLLG